MNSCFLDTNCIILIKRSFLGKVDFSFSHKFAWNPVFTQVPHSKLEWSLKLWLTCRPTSVFLFLLIRPGTDSCLGCKGLTVLLEQDLEEITPTLTSTAVKSIEDGFHYLFFPHQKTFFQKESVQSDVLAHLVMTQIFPHKILYLSVLETCSAAKYPRHAEASFMQHCFFLLTKGAPIKYMTYYSFKKPFSLLFPKAANGAFVWPQFARTGGGVTSSLFCLSICPLPLIPLINRAPCIRDSHTNAHAPMHVYIVR